MKPIKEKEQEGKGLRDQLVSCTSCFPKHLPPSLTHHQITKCWLAGDAWMMSVQPTPPSQNYSADGTHTHEPALAAVELLRARGSFTGQGAGHYSY